MRAYQGIFARFNLSSSASSASDFFFRPPRPRNPILLFNLSSCFVVLVVPSFSEESSAPSLFFFLPESRKSRKSKRNFNAKISFFEAAQKTKRGRKKRETRQLSLNILFFYISSSRKEYTHTTTQTRALKERLKERDDY